MWHAHILTLFPEVFPGPLDLSVLGKARKNSLWDLSVHNIRDFAPPPHYNVDDTPFGGGPGMVMRADVIESALLGTNLPKGMLIYPSPSGERFTAKVADELAQEEHLTFLCGRYEGIDQRAIDAYDMREISVGDFILAGGEMAAMVMIEACVRLLPHVLGDPNSSKLESFTTHPHLLEHAHFTRPRLWREREVPHILHSGDHTKILNWRKNNAQERTQKLRPDLWKKYKENTQD